MLVSQIADNDKSNISGTLQIELPRDKENDLRAAMESSAMLMARTITRSADAENTVNTKLGMNIQVISLDRSALREMQTLSLAAMDVQSSFGSILSAVRDLGGRVLTSQVNEQNRPNITGVLDFEVPSDKAAREGIEKAMSAAGVVFGRSVSRSADLQSTVDVKMRMQVTISSVDQLEPKKRTILKLEASDVEKLAGEIGDAALKAGGRIISSTQSTDSSGRASSHVVVDVPLDKADGIQSNIERMGTLRVKDWKRNPTAPDGSLAQAQLDVTLANPDVLVTTEQGVGATFRRGLSTSIRGLLGSLQILLIGVLVAVPWVLIGWGGWKIYRRRSAKAG